jgi:hypothetical protein
VVRYFLTQEKSFIPQQFSAIGYAETRPVWQNDSEEGRSRNRRIDLVLTQLMDHPEPHSSNNPDDTDTPASSAPADKKGPLNPTKALHAKPHQTAHHPEPIKNTGFKIRYGHVTPEKPKSVTHHPKQLHTEPTNEPPTPQASHEEDSRPL